MHDTVKNLLDIQNNIKINLNNLNIINDPKIVAVSKTFKIDKILPLIEHGHIDYGENKVQEAVEKWTEIKKINPQLRLHMIGKLQTNKVKFAVQIFDYIQTPLDARQIAKLSNDQWVYLMLNSNLIFCPYFLWLRSIQKPEVMYGVV